MKEYWNDYDRADVVFNLLMRTNTEIPRNFKQLYTTIPQSSNIAVPRDRPLNTFELMLTPFTGRVWIILVTILVSTELVKHFVPTLFQNSPILLVVCGFERRSLHQAGRWEKTTLLSLIVLMFFMSNAFETKIISLIITKPSIQRIKTLDDLYVSDLKFHEDLELFPHLVNDSIIGKMVVHGRLPKFGEKVPGVAMTWNSEWTHLFNELYFDYTRMEPFYVVLPYEFFTGYEMYGTLTRFPYLEVFRLMHINLVEAGLINLWKRQFNVQFRAKHVKHRFGTDSEDSVELSFDDMKIAWAVLTVGFGCGFVGFVGELVTKLFSSIHVTVEIRYAR